MADVFLSYAREDAKRAARIAALLIKEKLSVWWDPHIPTGDEWEKALRPELETARSIVVLWSRHSVQSKWVLDEARAGMERTALVPALIDRVEIPDVVSSIQAVTLSHWSLDGPSQGFEELVRAIRSHMLPACEIRFDSTLEPNEDSIRSFFDVCLLVAGRFVDANSRSFSRPKNAADEQRLVRGIASLQVTVRWSSELESLFEYPDATFLRDLLVGIPRRVPHLWLSMLGYSGPFYCNDGTRALRNYLRFAALRLFFLLRRDNARVPAPLRSDDLLRPRWEHVVARFEGDEETSRAYVTHIDEVPLGREFVVYGSRHRSEEAYRRSLFPMGFTDPLWLADYLVPQFELALTPDQPGRQTRYKGDARIRKITDLEGNDLELSPEST